MRKRDLAARLDELERRVRELEAQPLPMQAPVIVSPPTYAPYIPWWQTTTAPSYPFTYPVITCGTTANGVTATNATNVYTGSPC